MSIVGWLGSTALALCAFPAAYQAWRDGHANGINGLFLTLWFLGEVLTLVYVAPTLQYPLIANYGLNVVLLLIITRYKIYPGG